ncbi:hypothetical protein C9374_014060 [Naegleria lovaniensis]|uniref:Tc1-like transposase DDE domain-containing protein n=1 Tax=Naegleria lovaniensis TaxID=51637 RepID=A0AA88KMZ9_NAELO|nr:uncharacterized protein C9374_011062 [Naegleria lovaniensis]XP_044549704.1 uncharacterized protein C9374_003526 [Naegleria lovaniensis]XP_044553492.1 uncharacterized protein C9374_014060 [Naegleria lovaniensis]KAG2374225.1 hypothetical protein C9374_011062 [Naegleria lovaniensis]KAG2385711.1 hypothetical protein C9374_003526 [Naegleria lovaniensis]KAG2389500.1 hypothetical protein C9374_014060 [Naegleria lovaniensis]
MVKATQHRFTNDERRVFKQKTGVQISQKLRPYIQGQKLAPEQIEFIKLVCGKYGDKPKVLQQILPFAPSTIYKYCNEIQKEKALGRPPHSGKSTHLSVLRFIDIIFSEYNTVNYAEVRQIVKDYLDVSISISQLSKITTKYLFRTYKKCEKVSVYRKSPRVQSQRTVYRRTIRTYKTRIMFFIDESHFCYDHLIRTRAHIKIGNTCQNSAHRVSGKRFSLLACINERGGLVYWELVDTTNKAIDADRFNIFLTTLSKLIPKDCILVLDNASIHKEKEVHRIMNGQGISVFWQSPYSPDFNPIELLFGWMKTQLKNYEHSVDSLEEIMEQVFDQVTPKLIKSFVHHCKEIWHDETKT